MKTLRRTVAVELFHWALRVDRGAIRQLVLTSAWADDIRREAEAR